MALNPSEKVFLNLILVNPIKEDVECLKDLPRLLFYGEPHF